MTPDERLHRDLRRFARLHIATLDSDEATRLSLESLCRRAVGDDLDSRDLAAILDAIDELLMGEMARNHR